MEENKCKDFQTRRCKNLRDLGQDSEGLVYQIHPRNTTNSATQKERGGRRESETWRKKPEGLKPRAKWVTPRQEGREGTLTGAVRHSASLCERKWQLMKEHELWGDTQNHAENWVPVSQQA